MTTSSTTMGGVSYGRPLELKTRDEGWTVEGYCSTWDLDLGGDVVVPGAYRKTLADGHRVRFLYAHQPDQVLGVPLSLGEDRRGLYGKFKISRTARGEDVRTLLLDQAIDSFSVGYVVRDHEVERATGVRRLKEIELLEVSLVALPMNPQAVVTSAKAAQRKSLVEAYLRGYVARVKARRRVGPMTAAQVQREAEAMRLRLAVLGAWGGGGAGGR